MLQMRRYDTVPAAALLVWAALLPSHRHMPVDGVRAAESAPGSIAIDYPRDGSVFPPEITPPTFLWRDDSEATDRWRIEIRFSDGARSLTFESAGPRMGPGEIDPRCISANNELPKLPPEQASAHTWKPDASDWEKIKKRSISGRAEVIVEGIRSGNPETVISTGHISMETSRDPVGAPIFYRDVPLMPSEGEKGVIKPLASTAIHLIQWRLKSISQTGSRVVLEEMHTCANCHSFSRDGKTLGIDMDGPQNDKGLYAAVTLKPQTEVRTVDMIKWNPSQDPGAAFNRVGFMSQVSPDGRYVLTMLGSPERPPENKYYVVNFKDYRFLQVFYPTRGVLYWYDRTNGRRQTLPGADDPDYVQTNGVWSPDGKYIVFARAKAVDPYPPGRPLAAKANDPNEIPIQYDLYRITFNDGRGGKAEPIIGASANGMSNSFPKVSPDGKWIVFVEARNGEVMRPDGKLYMVPAGGGQARELNANMSPMNSWHSWSPNGRWLVFTSKSRGPYTKMYLTHIDENGNDTPAILIEDATAANRAVNLPEFVNIRPDGLLKINTPAVEMYAKFDHAAELGTKGEEAQAIREWRELSASNPDDERVWNNLGAALTRMGQYAEAVRDFERALALNPQYALVRGNLARALDGVGRDEDAMREYQKAAEAAPDSAELHVSFGKSLEKHGYGDLALREFERAVELQPDSAEGHNELGLALLEGGERNRASQAEEEFRKAIASNPHYAEAANNLGTLYGESGRDREAEEMFREALHDAPGMTKAMVNLGAILASESKFAEAEAEVERALKLEPENREALELLRMIRGAHKQGGGERK